MLARTVLDNGLRVITEALPHVRSVAAGLWIAGGSRCEPEHLAGISHFVEHLAFKGTTTRSARDLAAAIDQIGGRMNAYTSREYTCFHVKTLDEHLGDALELMADMVLRPRFDPTDVETERGVVLEEFRVYEDTPDELVHDLAAACLWPDHPLGRPVLGSREALQAFDETMVRSFHRDSYRPEHAVLVIVGRVDHAEAVERVAELFGDWAARPAATTADRDAPRGSARRCVRVKDTEQVHFCLVGEGRRLGDPDFVGAMAMVNLLGGGSSSRLFQTVREERGLAYSIYAFQDGFRDTGMVGVYAGTGVETARCVLELIFAEMQRLGRIPVAQDELARTREQLKTDLVLSLESPSARMSYIGRSELLLGRVVDVDELLDRVDAVDAGKVQELARQMLDPDRLALAAVAPAAEPLGLDVALLPPGP